MRCQGRETVWAVSRGRTLRDVARRNPLPRQKVLRNETLSEIGRFTCSLRFLDRECNLQGWVENLLSFAAQLSNTKPCSFRGLSAVRLIRAKPLDHFPVLKIDSFFSVKIGRSHEKSFLPFPVRSHGGRG